MLQEPKCSLVQLESLHRAEPLSQHSLLNAASFTRKLGLKARKGIHQRLELARLNGRFCPLFLLSKGKKWWQELLKS